MGFVSNGRSMTLRPCLGRSMSHKRFSPNSFTYSTIIDGLCEAGRLGDAQNNFDGMQSTGEVANIVTHNTLLDGLCKSWQLKEAIGLLQRMLDRGIVPDIIGCSTLINGFCEACKLDDAQKLFCVHVEKKMRIQVRTYNIMTDELCKGGKLDEAEALMTKMEANGCSSDDFTCSITVQAFLQKHEISKENDVCKCCSAFTESFGLIANLLSSNNLDASEKQMLEKFYDEVKFAVLKQQSR